MPSWWPRAVVGAALAAAATLTFAAARERWWPACPRGGFDSAACLRAQDHELDYYVPAAPWAPAGHAATYAGLALLATAVAALALPALLRPRPRPVGSPWTTVLVGAVPAAALTALGAATLGSGLTAEPAPDTALLTGAGLVWALAWPGAVLVYAATATGRAARDGVLLAVLVGLSTPVPVLLFLGPLAAGYTSHDTAPWTEATGAPFLLAAALVVVAGFRERPVAARRHRSLSERAARLRGEGEAPTGCTTETRSTT